MFKNNIRKILLGVIFLLMTVSIISLVKSLNKKSLPVETLKMMSKNVDIEIENFKVTHEALGNKDWEIKAKEAKVKNEESKIILTDVNVTLNSSKNQKSTISADSGTINRETKDIQLEGNVKFKSDVDSFFGQLQQQTSDTKEPDNQ
ncbi:MAG: LPS export ABC transporter periplasmic protein LptC [Nitrospinota bacterium]|nr:LPS export ABC transporter periplasmic protein LptC [Nitrospinota bacterium]